MLYGIVIRGNFLLKKSLDVLFAFIGLTIYMGHKKLKGTKYSLLPPIQFPSLEATIVTSFLYNLQINLYMYKHRTEQIY